MSPSKAKAASPVVEDGASSKSKAGGIEILIEAPQWESFADIRAIALEAASLALSARGKDGSALNILLADDATMRRLNRQFRGRDEPTNVLSFPAARLAAEEEASLGDIALGYETVMREADDQGKPTRHHIQHLLIHGVLHLLGFDHESDAQAHLMESLETQLLALIGIPNPYLLDPVGD